MMKRRKAPDPEERAQSLYRENVPLQFFAVGDERDALGSIKIDDYRLDKILFEALSAHPAFKWDETENEYVVDVEGPPQPLPTAYTNQAFRHKPIVANDEDRDDALLDEAITKHKRRNKTAGAITPPSPKPSGSAPPAENPKWRGVGDENGHYISKKLGWKLDLIKDDRPAGLPRGERGKHWRLTHPDAPENEVWYKSMGDAREAITDGSANKEFFA